MKNRKAHIKKLIADNQTEKVFTLLQETLEETDLQEYKNDIVLLQAKFTTLKKEQRLYLADRKDITLDYNQLNDSLLKTVDVIFESIETADKDQVGIKSGGAKASETKKILVPAILLLGAAITIFIIFKFAIGPLLNRPAPVTIIVKSKNDIPLPPKGEVLLNYGGVQIAKEINNNNEAIFTEVPADYFQQESKVKINFQDPQGEPYKAIFPDSIYQLKRNATIELFVALSGLDGIFGIVKDHETGKYLEGVRVSILDIASFSNENGWFEIKLPAEKQQKFHTIRAELSGYQLWEKQNIPLQTDKELIIQLKR